MYIATRISENAKFFNYLNMTFIMLLRYGNLNLGYSYFITINYLTMRKRYSEIFFYSVFIKGSKDIDSQRLSFGFRIYS